VTRLCSAFGAVVALTACARAPSPLSPALHGSVGAPSCGVLAGGRQVAQDAEGLRWLRANDRHWAQPRFAAAIERAAARVAAERPGARVAIGDLSTRTGGGPLPPHFSHRSGMDADLLFYVTTLDGVSVDSPGFVHFGADGLARDEAHGRWLRLDVDREWRLVRALLEDGEARVQWIFVSEVVQAMLIQWALAHGDAATTIERAERVMLEPHPGGVHDDHIHVRTTCSPEELLAGCEPVGPKRPWLAFDLPAPEDRDEDLALSLLRPLAPAPEPAADNGHVITVTVASPRERSGPVTASP
jgi:penicillin-insensitive murein endopeptidase